MAKIKAEKFVINDETRKEFISTVLVPLVNKHLVEETKRLGYECNFNADAFMHLWAAGQLLFLTAWEEDKVVGFLIGYKTQPIFTALPTLCIERWDCASDDITSELIKYAIACADILNAVKVEIIESPWRKVPSNAALEYDTAVVRTINMLK